MRDSIVRQNTSHIYTVRRNKCCKVRKTCLGDKENWTLWQCSEVCLEFYFILRKHRSREANKQSKCAASRSL